MSRLGSRLVVLAAVSLAAAGAAAAPSADDVLAKAGFSDADRPRVMAGELVTADVATNDPREIAAALAFLVKQPPAALVAQSEKNLLVTVDPNTRAWGEFHGDGSLADLKKLQLGADRLRAYLAAAPGDDLNLSSDEIQAFQALAKSGAGEAAVTDAVRNQLLARYRAYHTRGLAGIAPYARSGSATSAGDILTKFTRSSQVAAQLFPAFFGILLGYPAKTPPQLGERFEWTDFTAHGQPVFLLTHRMTLADGNTWTTVQRQFYVSGSYNAEQALAGFFPVPEGTLVLYANRTSTDAVMGFGGSAKRSIGEKVMASELQSLFTKVRNAAQQ